MYKTYRGLLLKLAFAFRLRVVLCSSILFGHEQLLLPIQIETHLPIYKPEYIMYVYRFIEIPQTTLWLYTYSINVNPIKYFSI